MKKSLVLVLLIVACRPHYGPALDSADGYLEDELSHGILQIHFQFNPQPFFPYIGPTFDQLTLLRAADLTLERGYSYFIVDKNALPGVTRGGRTLTIKLFSEPPAREDLTVYDARRIASKIRARHRYLSN